MANTQTTRKEAKRAVATVKRAAIYVRVSSERQAKTKNGDGQEEKEKESPQAQERDCRALADKQGYTVVAVYSDTQKYRVGKKLVEPSGTRFDRPGLRQMLADARAGKFDVILAWREDRLYRSYRPMLDVLDCLEETGIDIELAKETFDKNIAPVKAWAARMELQAKHDRLMMGVAGKLASGKSHNLRPPYGYKLIDGTFELVPDEVKIVEQIWSWYGSGIDPIEIRRRLIAAGATQKVGGTKHVWAVDQIRRTLKYTYYHTGIFKVHWGGQVFELTIPVIVDAKTAQAVNKRRAQYKEYPAGNLKAQVLGAGRVYCKACDAVMSVTDKKIDGNHYVYYYCGNCKRNERVDGCVKYQRVDKVDAETWRKAWEVITDPAKFEARVRAALAEKQAQEADAAAACKELESKLDVLDFERQRVVTAYRKGKITDDELDTQKAAIWIEECEVKRELADKRLLVGGRAERFIAVAMDYRERLVKGAQVNFDPQTPEEKQALFEYKRWVVQGTVKRIDVWPDKTVHPKIEFDDAMLEGEPSDLQITDPLACYLASLSRLTSSAMRNWAR